MDNLVSARLNPSRVRFVTQEKAIVVSRFVLDDKEKVIGGRRVATQNCRHEAILRNVVRPAVGMKATRVRKASSKGR